MTVLEGLSTAKRRQVVLASGTAGFLFFSTTMLYFSRFPVMVSTFVSNAFMMVILVAWAITLLTSSLAATRESQVGLTLIGIWLYGFAIRSVSPLDPSGWMRVNLVRTGPSKVARAR